MKTFQSLLRPLLALFVGLGLISFPTLGHAQSYPPAWNSTASYAVGDVVQENGNWYRAIRAVSAHNLDPAKYFTYWELNYVRSNTTLLIGADEPFATFLDAWNYALNAKVSDAVYLHFYISSHHANFNQQFSGSFYLDHQSGGAISIEGDTAANVVFNFKSVPPANSGGVGGLFIDGGHTIASISNITVLGSAPYIGLTANNDGSIGLLTNVVFNGFSTGIEARMNAAVVGLYNCSFVGIPFAAVHAVLGGNISCNNFTFNAGASDTTYGMLAEYGGTIAATDAVISGTNTAIQANYGGVILAEFAELQNNTYGATATYHATIDVENANISSSAQDDLTATTGAIIDASAANFTTQSTGTNDGSYIFD
jgi:hypothetical protein